MSLLRKLKSVVLGQHINMEGIQAELQAANVPLSTADCRICPNPCDEGHEEWPRKFDVDFETRMLGAVKPYRRQVVISTGKSDWEREVTEANGTLATYLAEVQKSAPEFSPPAANPPASSAIEGVFTSSQASKVSILNGSHTTVADDHAEETVLVFPDWKLVTGVHNSAKGAQQLWTDVLDPSLGLAVRQGKEAGLKSWILPYSCVILLCSHKRRDNRCHIAAPKLEAAFAHSLSNHNYDVHTQPEDPSHHAQPPLEDFDGSTEEQDAEIARRVELAADGELEGHGKKVLILRNSHIGGHKFAGNVIIYTPNGVGVWYGRVSTHEVESIVANTIIGGQVLAPLLRGGMNLQKPGCKSFHDW